MALSTETFARLTEVPRPFRATAATAAELEERRRQGRVAMGQRGQVRPAGGGEWQTVLIRDLSIEGFGFQADAAVAKGQPLVLRLDWPSGVTAELPSVVRWCEPGGYLNAAFHVGAMFVEPPPGQGPGPTRPAWLAGVLMDLRLRQAVEEAK